MPILICWSLPIVILLVVLIGVGKLFMLIYFP